VPFNLATVENLKWKGHGPRFPGQKSESLCPDNQSKKGWKHGSSSVKKAHCPALSSNPSITKKKKKKKKRGRATSGTSGRKLGHWESTLEGDIGTLVPFLFLSHSLPDHELSSFSITCSHHDVLSHSRPKVTGPCDHGLKTQTGHQNKPFPSLS
jgi:hypothetical protein